VFRLVVVVVDAAGDELFVPSWEGVSELWRVPDRRLEDEVVLVLRGIEDDVDSALEP